MVGSSLVAQGLDDESQGDAGASQLSGAGKHRAGAKMRHAFGLLRSERRVYG